MIKSGYKTRQWDQIRAQIKKDFLKLNIIFCEFSFPGCRREIQGFAHKDKRRNLTKDELWHVVGSCNFCHNKIEYHPEMEKIITKKIKGRNQLKKLQGYLVPEKYII